MTPTFTTDWFTGREFQLSLWLARFAHQPIHALEVGCFEGRSTLYFLRDIVNHPDSTITCVDTFGGSIEHAGIDFAAVKARFLDNVLPWGSRVQLCIGPSASVLPGLPRSHYAFAYIDGSHRAADVERDARLTWPLLIPGGVLIFDDYLWDGHAGTPDETRLGIDRFAAATSHTPTPAYQFAMTKPL